MERSTRQKQENLAVSFQVDLATILGLADLEKTQGPVVKVNKSRL